MDFDKLSELIAGLRRLASLVPDKLVIALLAVLGIILICALIIRAFPQISEDARDEIARLIVRFGLMGTGMICMVSFAWAITTGRQESFEVGRGIRTGEFEESATSSNRRLLDTSLENVSIELVALSRRLDAPEGMNDAIVNLKKGNPRPMVSLLKDVVLPRQRTVSDRIAVQSWIGLLCFYTNTDSAIEAYRSIVQLDPSNTVAWAQLAILDERRGRTKEADSDASNAKTQAERSKDQFALGLAQTTAGIISLRRGNLPNARAAFERARSEFRDSRSQGQFAAATLGLASTYYTDGRYSTASELYSEAERLFEKLGNGRGKASAILGLANVENQIAHPEIARENFDKARKLAADSGDLDQEATASAGLGDVYLAEKNFSKAQVNYLKALTLRQELNDQLGMAYGYGKVAKLAHAQNQSDDAIDYYKSAIEIARKISPFAAAVHERGLGIVYFDKKDWNAGLRAFDDARALDEQLGLPVYVAVDQTWIGELHRNLQEKESACEHWRRAMLLYRESGKTAEVIDVTSRMNILKCKLQNKADETHHD